MTMNDSLASPYASHFRTCKNQLVSSRKFKVIYHVGTKNIDKTVTEYIVQKQDAIDYAEKLAESLELTKWKGREGHWVGTLDSDRGAENPCRHLIIYCDGVAIDSKY